MGSKVWEHVYYITENDVAYRLTQCGDSGYAVVGTSSQTATQRDAWLLRVDRLGDTLWTRLYGGTYNDAAGDIVGTEDGGFAFAGYTYSFSGQPGTRRDGWLVRLASNGDTLWTRTFPGVYGEGGVFSSVRMLQDHGFLLAGTDDARNGEGWVVQTDSLGNLVWQGAWGDISEQNWDHIVCAQPTDDGGCIAFGSSYTFSTPSFDAWMLKIDSLCLAGVSGSRDVGLRRPATSTIARGVLLLQRDLSEVHVGSSDRVPRPALLDATGRRVLDLRPGANNVSCLAPGVYFVKPAGNTPGAKVILQR